MKERCRAILAGIVVFVLFLGCGEGASPATPIPSAVAPDRPTETPPPTVLPTAPPTASPAPTAIPPTATPPKPLDGRGGGVIAFAAYGTGSRGDLHVVNADGSGLRQLTHTGKISEFHPTWSPDGRHLAFSAKPDDGEADIWVFDVEEALQDPIGVVLVRLTDNEAEDENPAWSPDGTQILFESRRDGNREIYVMAADGQDPRRLTDNPARDSDPAWSPDGSQIVFSSWRDGNPQIYVMASDGSQLRRVTENAFHNRGPAWSPNGRLIAFDSTRDGNRDIYVVRADGSGERRLTHDPSSDMGPVWSPDGTQIAFARQLAVNSTVGVYVMKASGVEQRRIVLAELGQLAWRPGPPSTPGGSAVIGFTSSRDGNRETFDWRGRQRSALAEFQQRPGRHSGLVAGVGRRTGRYRRVMWPVVWAAHTSGARTQRGRIEAREV